MIHLPLPILTFALSLLAAGFVWRVDPGPRFARGLFVAFFLLGALMSLIVTLRFGYGIEGFRRLQAIPPFLGGPLLYAAYLALIHRGRRLATQAALHVVAIPAVVLSVLIGFDLGQFVDLAIMVSYLCYAAGLVMISRKGADHLGRARLERAPLLSRAALWGAVFFAGLAVIDGSIALSFTFGLSEAALGLISLGAVVQVGLLGSLILWLSRQRDTTPPPETPTEDPLLTEADALLREKELYLDTDLTVDRLARRLGVPSRSLSEAVNRSRGQNVSQYVNDHRVAHAARLLTETRLPATKVAEQSGFLTRSNFYREFQRVHDMTPAAFRATSDPDAD